MDMCSSAPRTCDSAQGWRPHRPRLDGGRPACPECRRPARAQPDVHEYVSPLLHLRISLTPSCSARMGLPPVRVHVPLPDAAVHPSEARRHAELRAAEHHGLPRQGTRAQGHRRRRQAEPDAPAPAPTGAPAEGHADREDARFVRYTSRPDLLAHEADSAPTSARLRPKSLFQGCRASFLRDGRAPITRLASSISPSATASLGHLNGSDHAPSRSTSGFTSNFDLRTTPFALPPRLATFDALRRSIPQLLALVSDRHLPHPHALSRSYLSPQPSTALAGQATSVHTRSSFHPACSRQSRLLYSCVLYPHSLVSVGNARVDRARSL
jgi:hypothetical protein